MMPRPCCFCFFKEYIHLKASKFSRERSKMAIVLPKNFDSSDITFDAVKKNAMGGNIVYIKYQDQPKLRLQTPVLSAPFGLSTFIDDKTGAVKYILDISFRGSEEDPKIMQFQEKMVQLDDYLLDQAVERSKEWFGKKQSKEVVENFYRPIVKPAKDPTKYAPTMKFKIQTKRGDGTIDVEAFDSDRNPLDIKDAMVPGVKIQAIIEASSVWFVNKTMFGISWRLVQIKVLPSDKLAGFSFQNEDEEEEEYEYEEVSP